MILRRLTQLLAALLVLLIVAALAVEVISWNFLKPVIADRTQTAAGRELTIGGDVEVHLLPRPALVLEELALANPRWAHDPHLAEIKRLSLAPDLLALLTGRIELARVEVAQPRVMLLALEDGRVNWELAGGASDGGPTPVHRANIADGFLSYRRARDEPRLELAIPSLVFGDDGNELTLDGQLVLDGRKISIEGQGDSLLAPPAQEPFEGTLLATSQGSELRGALTAPAPPRPTHWQAQVDARLEGVESWLSAIPGAPSAAPGNAALDASLARSGATWRASDFKLSAWGSRVQGALAVDAATAPMTVEGRLRVDPLDLTWLPPGSGGDGGATDAASSQPPLPPVLPALDGTISLAITDVKGLPVPVSDVDARLAFAVHEIAVRDASATVAGGRLQGAARLSSDPERVAAALTLTGDAVALAGSSAGDAGAGKVSGTVDAKLTPIARDDWGVVALGRHLKLSRAQVRYVRPYSDTRLTAQATMSGEERRPTLAIDGTFRGKELEARIQGDALTQTDSWSRYGLKVEASSSGLAASASSTFASLSDPTRLEADFEARADSSGDLGPWLDTTFPPSPPLAVAGRLARDGATWRAQDLEGAVGDGSFTGRLLVENQARPDVRLSLQAGGLDLAWLGASGEEGSAGTDEGSTERKEDARSAAPALSRLQSFDGRIDLSAERLLLPEAPPLADLKLEAGLQDGTLALERLRARVAGGSAEVAGRLDAARTPATGSIDAAFKAIALGRVADTFTPLEERLGEVSGKLEAELIQPTGTTLGEEAAAPAFGRLRVESLVLNFVDEAADTDLEITASATPQTMETGPGLQVDGSGRYDGYPFSLRLRSASLLAARKPDRAFALDLDSTVVQTDISLQGSLRDPFALEGIDLDLSVSGPNPERLSRLSGVALPELPPYAVSGDLLLKEGRWVFSDFSGTVGDSDLRGSIAFNTTVEPPRLTGDFESDSLDLDDLAGIVGAQVGVGEDEVASEAQRRAAREAEADDFLLPDEPLLGGNWKVVDADLHYSADAVRAGKVPLSGMRVDFTMTGGVARLQPLRFGVGDGEVNFELELDTAATPLGGTMRVDLRAVDLGVALQRWELAEDSVGLLGAQGKFWIEGDSIGALAGSMDGGMVVLMTGGRLDALLVEAAGLDLTQSFLSWATDREALPINCAYADLQAREGVLRLDTVLVDTDDTIFSAGGVVDLGEERLDISIVPNPQDVSALVGRTPLHLGGSFASPEPSLHAGELGLRLAGSAGLAALATPLAAALPLLDFGGDDRTGYCRGLLERASRAIDDKREGKP